MKDSGIEWIGEIPKGWNIGRLKNYVLFNPKHVNDKKIGDDDIVSFMPMECLRTGCIEPRTIIYKSALVYTPFENEDIVMAKVTPCFENGNIAIAYNLLNGYGFGSSEIFVFRCNSDLSNKFLYYYLQSNFIKAVGISSMTGTGGLKRVNPTILNNTQLLFPPLSEQQSIANQLDTKCAEIDNLISLQEEMIAELKAYKQSVITEVVCKGLDKNVPMKDSGVEWIGDIPEHWDICRLKDVLSTKDPMRVGPFGSALKGNDFIGEGYWVYNQRTVLDNNFISNDTFISEDKYNELSGFQVEENDVLITTRGSIGKISLVPKDYKKGVIHPCIIKFRINDNLYFYPLMEKIFNSTDLIMKQLSKMSNSTTIDVVYSYNLKNVILLLIPLSEQQAIASYLDKKCANIDQLISIKQQKAIELKEYKKSLIYEYVTGKKEVI